MKILTELKRVYCMNRFSILIMAISLMIGVSSCGDNDDSDTPGLSLNDVSGNYTGKMLTLAVVPQTEATEETEQGLDVTAEVKDNHVFFKKLPVEDLIKSIVSDEETATGIIAALGDVSYKVAYTASFNEKQDIIYLQLDPQPLELELPLPSPTEGGEPLILPIKVTITADQKGNFAYANHKLDFSLHVTKVVVGAEPLPDFSPITFKFDLNKK